MDAIMWPNEFLAFLKCCERHGARTLVFGGFAVSLHARPRTTGDLDLWCGLDAQNWERVKAALKEFGFDQERVASLGDAKPDMLIRFGYEPIRIELFTPLQISTSIKHGNADACCALTRSILRSSTVSH